MNPLADFFASNVDYTYKSTDLGTVDDEVDERRGSNNRVTKSGPVKKTHHRVCDRCIVKKVKCDMKESQCSRCQEADVACIYSVKKRKPGPAKGSKHTQRRTSKDTSHRSSVSDASSPVSRPGEGTAVSQSEQFYFDQPLEQNLQAMASVPLSMSGTQASNLFNSTTSSPGMLPSIPSPLGIPPSQTNQRRLLDSFLLHIHPSIPLFHQQRFMARYDAGKLSPHLLLTICVVTAKTLGMFSFWDGSSLDDCTAFMLDLKVLENEGMGRPLSLDNFRQACLLAFYAFHQYPSEEAWMRIGNLTRKAYQCGLHQIDYQGAGGLFDREAVSLGDLEEWRYVWWCIYCMDCYSNVTAVTPFIVEIESIKTALVSTSLTASIESATMPTSIRYLPDDTDLLWKTAKEVTTSSGEINFNMHILTTTMIREAATIHRLRKQSTSKRLVARLADLEDHFSAFRLALPIRYLNASRNVMMNESSAEHHARLICVLHIHLARILTYFPYNPNDNEADWSMRWRLCLECAEDIVSVVKQWDGQYFTATDPAICFIIALASTLLHLHSCAAEASYEFKVRMENHKDVLVLFLEQFATAWSLPRFLLISLGQFKKMITAPLAPAEIDRTLKVSVGPMNYRWLNSLSLNAEMEPLESPARVFENLFSQEWDSSEWEALMPMDVPQIS